MSDPDLARVAVPVTRQISAKQFWNAQAPDMSGMLLDDQASELEARDCSQILAQLRLVGGEKVLELGAGIGRFSGHLARVAAHVTAVDFNESFVQTNRRSNSSHSNIAFVHQDVMKLSFPTHSFDFVFSNWLLMYLSDAQVEEVVKRVACWLKPGGFSFFRESCVCSSGGNPESLSNPASYRHPDFYERCFAQSFKVLQRGNVLVYEEVHNNPNQQLWLLESRAPPSQNRPIHHA